MPTLVPGASERFRQSTSAVTGSVLMALLVAGAIGAPWIARYDPGRQDLANTQAPPSAAHWFGTDQLGRDQFARVIYGTRIALAVGVIAVLAAVLVGIVMASLAVTLGRWFDLLVTRLTDVFLSFPVLLGALVLAATMGRGFAAIVIALTAFGWATPARLLRGSLLTVSEAEYVRAARAMGVARWQLLGRHLLPNSVGPVLVYGVVTIPAAIVTEAALSYLGVGFPPGTADWGLMIAEGQKFFGYRDFLWAAPASALTITTLAFVLLADGVRDALDPRRAR